MKPIKFSNVFILNSEGRILILSRTIEHPTRSLALDLPGGGLEVGESSVHAAVREVKEETNIDIDLTQLQLIRMRKHDLPERSIEGAVYVFRLPQTDIVVTLSNEHDKYYWIKPYELKNLPEFHQESLMYALENKYLS